MRHLRNCLFAILLTLPTKALAVDGGFIFAMCRENRDACLMYVIGVSHGSIAGWVGGRFFDGPPHLTRSNPTAGSCDPENINYGQMRDIFMEYLENYPERRTGPGATLLHEALLEAFSCE